MSRTFMTEGIILKASRFGEIHKSVALLCPEHGILHAIAHGALKMKSKLRSSSQPFYHVRAYLYHDPVKNSYKITDLEMIRQFFGISQSIEKYYAASLFSEIILRSHGGGESGIETFGLMRDALGCLDGAGIQDVCFVIIQFIYRYLVMTGYGPELRSCGRCGKILAEDARVCFHTRSHEFTCADCSFGESVHVSPGMLKYLGKTGTLEFGKSMEIRLEKGTAIMLKTIMYALIEALLEAPLASIRSAEGII
jgi:DNA repair protein RecO (recombination protein O)